MQHKIFVFVGSLKLSRRLLYSVRLVFVSTFNLQRGRAFLLWISNLNKWAVCVKAKAPADHVYQRRTCDEFKRVLSVAHVSEPVEQADNLEYRNQLSGVCWGTVYCSSHKDLRSESIFLNHAVFIIIVIIVLPLVYLEIKVILLLQNTINFFLFCPYSCFNFIQVHA